MTWRGVAILCLVAGLGLLAFIFGLWLVVWTR